MPTYRYTGRGPQGEALSGSLEADSVDAVATRLLDGGITPVEIEESAEGSGETLGGMWRRLRPERASFDDIILFSRQMYALTKAGVPLIRGLRGLGESTRNEAMREAIRDIVDSLESGREFSNAMARHRQIFSTLYISLVRVGESSGTLEDSFLRMYEYLMQDKSTREKIKQAVRYPIIVMTAIAIAVGIITVFVIPAFANVFARADVELPLATRIILGLSDFMVTWWWAVIAVIAATVASFRMWVKTDAGRQRWDRAIFSIPIIGDIILRATLARFARTFSITYRAGVPLVEALGLTGRALGNEFLGDRVTEMRISVERGESLLRAAAGVNLFTPLVLQMVAVGEETGQVDEMLEEVAGFYEREVAYDIDNLSAMIEPILLAAVGVMVLILALGVFLPMWELATAVG